MGMIDERINCCHPSDLLFICCPQVGALLSDPVGNGTTDYNLSVDLDGLWTESLRLLASTHGIPPEVLQQMPSGGTSPLKESEVDDGCQ